MRRCALIALAAALLTPPAAAGRVPDDPDTRASWATVNVCDTRAHPNAMGVRGGMSGLARRSRMSMRFRVQWVDDEGVWHRVGSGADSGWVRVATARGGLHDAGWSFQFKPPAAGPAHVLRGVVRFRWERRGRVVKRDRAVTEAGHPGTAGADPPDFSASTCAIA